MPTYLRLPRFNRDWERLRPQEQARFRAALAVFVADLAAGGGFRPGLRVKKMAGHDIWEMTWAPTAAPPSAMASRSGTARCISSGGGSEATRSSPRPDGRTMPPTGRADFPRGFRADGAGILRYLAAVLRRSGLFAAAEQDPGDVVGAAPAQGDTRSAVAVVCV